MTNLELTSIEDLISRLKAGHEERLRTREQAERIRYNVRITLEFVDEWLRADVDLRLRTALLDLRHAGVAVIECLNRKTLLWRLLGLGGYTACISKRYNALATGLREVCFFMDRPGLIDQLYRSL